MRVGLLMGMVLLTALPVWAQGTAAPAQGPTPDGPVLVFETEKGTFEISTYQSLAPKTVAHIVGLVRKGCYTGLRIHRVARNFVVQFGDPLTRDMTKKDQWGTGGCSSPIGVGEFGKGLKHSVGMVSMAHKGDPKGADSQMFIVIGPASHLDGLHQIWGKITSGMDVINKLAVPDRIIRASVKGAAK